MRALIFVLERLGAALDAAADTVWGWHAALVDPPSIDEYVLGIEDGKTIEFDMQFLPAPPVKRVEFRATVVPGSVRVSDEAVSVSPAGNVVTRDLGEVRLRHEDFAIDPDRRPVGPRSDEGNG